MTNEERISLLGKYVQYKSTVWLTVRAHQDGMIDIVDPINSLRRKVKSTSVTATRLRPATVVESYPEAFIVTAKLNIFSVKTGKLMMWDASNGKRRAILARLGDSV